VCQSPVWVFDGQVRAPKSDNEGSEALCVLIRIFLRSPQGMVENPGSVPRRLRSDDCRDRALAVRRQLSLITGDRQLTTESDDGFRAWWAYPASAVKRSGSEYDKGIRWMPWHQEAMKDVARCEKPRGAASRL
jgi:hypothetical protein